MNPYRTPDFTAIVAAPRRRSLLGRFRSLRRRLAVWNGGKFLDRFPVRCPCGKRSWHPEKVRSGIVPVGNAGMFSHRANWWRCGEKHGLVGTVRLG